MIRRAPFFLLTAVLFALACDARAACSRTLRAAWMEWMPYAFRAPDGTLRGMDIELVQLIAEEAGCKVHFMEGIPAKRQGAYLRAGMLDLQTASSDVAERHEYAWFSPPYRMEIVALFARSGEGRRYALSRLEDLAQREWMLIVPDAGWYGTRFEALRPALQSASRLSYYRSADNALQMLDGHRGDLVMGDYYAVVHAARGATHAPLDVLAVEAAREPIHLLMSKKSLTTADRDAINAAVERLAQRGALKAVAERYGVAPAEAARKRP